LQTGEDAESSADVKARVEAARRIQRQRFSGLTANCNSEMGMKEMKFFCAIDGNGASLLQVAERQFGLSARAFNRILKVARTIADLENCQNIETKHIAESLQYRTKN